MIAKLHAACALALLVGCAPPCGEGVAPELRSASAEATPTPAASVPVTESDPPGTYLGRRIAPTMSHEGAAWLTRPERETEEASARMLKELRLARGDVACDLGAGNGFHTLEMAKTVGPEGRVVAIDIQPEMLKLLQERAAAARVVNVQTVLATATDPKLPRGACDLILMADVYHELDDPAGMLAHVAAGLSPRGSLALLEFRAEDPRVPIKPEHKMSRAQIALELTRNGFELVRSFDELPWQHLVFYAPKRSR